MSQAGRADAVEEVILLNQCVAESIASRYARRGIPEEDLRQVAYEGLVKAVKRFDPTRDKDLLTYAVPTIRGEIRRYFRDLGWMVRPPRRVQELQSQVSEGAEQLAHDLGREPTRAEVLKNLDISVEDYDAAMAAYGSFQPGSLDRPQEAGSTRTVGETLPLEEVGHEAAEARQMLAPVVRRLPKRERRILFLRFYEDMTQAEIGEDLGVTQMQVSRLLSGIYRKVRGEIGEEI